MVFGIGLFITTNNIYRLPEDYRSSGNSVVRTSMDKINNYKNVDSYIYWLNADASERIYHLRDIKYSFWNEIPFRIDQYLQGICFAENFLLVSAYCESEEMLGELLIFDAKTGAYIMTFGLDEASHLGGITYDGDNIWVCNSQKKTIERISFKVLCKLIEEHQGKMVNITNLVDVYPIKNIPSCITYYDERLWVATHQKKGCSVMIAYQYNEIEDELFLISRHRIPSRVQGLVFEEDGAVIFSRSYGRKSSSCIVRYDALSDLEKNIYQWDYMIEMPPCSEGVAYENNRLYVVFESAGEKYYEGTDGYGTSLSPLNRILIIWDPA